MILKWSWGGNTLPLVLLHTLRFHCPSLIPSVDYELPEGIYFVTVSLMPTVEAPGVAKWTLYYLIHWQWLFCLAGLVSTSGCDAAYSLTPCPFSRQLVAPASCLPPEFAQKWEWAPRLLSRDSTILTTTPIYFKGGRKERGRWQHYPWSPLTDTRPMTQHTRTESSVFSGQSMRPGAEGLCARPALPPTMWSQYPFSDLNYSSMIGWGRLTRESSAFTMIMRFIWNHCTFNPQL